MLKLHKVLMFDETLARRLGTLENNHSFQVYALICPLVSMPLALIFPQMCADWLISDRNQGCNMGNISSFFRVPAVSSLYCA